MPIQFLQQSDLKIHPVRWGYLGKAVEYAKSLNLDNLPCLRCGGTGHEEGKPEAQCQLCGGYKVRPPRVLEIGSHNAQVCAGSTTMDIMPIGPTLWHDARNTPWPVSGEFDLMIACEVFEHFGEPDSGIQEVVWREAVRTCRNAIIDVPYMWENCPYDGHNGINEDTLLRWTGRTPDAQEIVTGDGSDARFLVGLYRIR